MKEVVKKKNNIKTNQEFGEEKKMQAAKEQ